ASGLFGLSIVLREAAKCSLFNTRRVSFTSSAETLDAPLGCQRLSLLVLWKHISQTFFVTVAFHALFARGLRMRKLVIFVAAAALGGGVLLVAKSHRAQIVFVGYGITAPVEKWDDYMGYDLKGKAALLYVNKPISDVPSFFKGNAM